jgi:hypothetical protein
MIRPWVRSGSIGLLVMGLLTVSAGPVRSEGQPIMRDLVSYPGSEVLAALRRQTLDGLRARHQQLNPFTFIIYSEWAGAALAPVE